MIVKSLPVVLLAVTTARAAAGASAGSMGSFECERWMKDHLISATPNIPEEAAPTIIAECQTHVHRMLKEGQRSTNLDAASECAAFVDWMQVLQHDGDDGRDRFANHICQVQLSRAQSNDESSQKFFSTAVSWIGCGIAVAGAAGKCVVAGVPTVGGACVLGGASAIKACGGVAGDVGGLINGGQDDDDEDDDSGTSTAYRLHERCSPERVCGQPEGDVRVRPDQCLRCEWSCDAPDSSWLYTGDYWLVGAGHLCWGNKEQYCKKYNCPSVQPPPGFYYASPPPPSPIPAGECRPFLDYGRPDSSIFVLTDAMEDGCSDYPANIVQHYLGASCADLACDGSYAGYDVWAGGSYGDYEYDGSRPSFGSYHSDVVRSFCPAKCGGCDSLCQDKSDLLQAFSSYLNFPSSCTADWPSAKIQGIVSSSTAWRAQKALNPNFARLHRQRPQWCQALASKQARPGAS